MIHHQPYMLQYLQKISRNSLYINPLAPNNPIVYFNIPPQRPTNSIYEEMKKYGPFSVKTAKIFYLEGHGQSTQFLRKIICIVRFVNSKPKILFEPCVEDWRLGKTNASSI